MAWCWTYLTWTLSFEWKVLDIPGLCKRWTNKSLHKLIPNRWPRSTGPVFSKIGLTLLLQMVSISIGQPKLWGKSPHPCSWSSSSNTPKPANQVLWIQLKIIGRLIESNVRTNLSVGRLISRTKDEDTCYRILVSALGNRVGGLLLWSCTFLYLLLVLEQHLQFTTFLSLTTALSLCTIMTVW